MRAALVGLVGGALLAAEYLQAWRAHQALHGLTAGRAVAWQVAFGAG